MTAPPLPAASAVHSPRLHARRALALPAWLLCCLAAGPANALSPEEIYLRGRDHVVMVTVSDRDGQPVDAASGLIIGANRVAVTCDLVLAGERLSVTAGGRTLEARRAGRDGERGLCTLAVPGVRGNDIRLAATPRVGEPVYLIRHAPGLGLALAAGIVSALRGEAADAVVQISAVSGDSSRGGGVYDRQGDLVGMYAAALPNAQDIGFVVPGRWVDELAARAQPMPAELQPSTRAEWRARVLALARNDQAGPMLEEARRWLQSRPLDAEAHALAALALFSLERKREAIDAYAEALRLDPALEHVVLPLVNLLLGENRLDEARAAAQSALKAVPRRADVWLALGAVRTAAGEAGPALEAYDTASRYGPAEAVVWQNSGIFHANNGRWNEAAAAARRWATLQPGNIGAWRLLSDALVAQGRHARAVRALQEVLASAPQKALLRYQLALVYAAWGKPSLAIDTAEQALAEGHPAPATVRYLQGHVLGQLLEHDQAAKKYREALRLDPSMRDAMLGLVEQLLRQGRQPEAVSEIRKAIDKAPGSAGNWATLADAYFDAGMIDRAIEANRKALELEPGRARSWAGLAMGHHANGNMAAMREAYVRMRQHDPVLARQFHGQFLLPYGEAP